MLLPSPPVRLTVPRVLLAAMAGAALLLAACGGGPGTTSGASTTTTTDPQLSSTSPSTAPLSLETPTDVTSEPPSTITEPRGPLGSGESVTLAFAGDASFEGLTEAVTADPDGLLTSIAPVLSAADVAVVNLEAALGTTGRPEAKSFAFQAPPQALEALRSAGVDAVTMANNHGMDYGEEGLADSLAIRASTGFPVLGIGADEDEAYSPWITDVRGQRIGVIAANDVFDSNLVTRWTAGPDKPGIASAEEAHQERLADEVRRTRALVDTLVVYLHYGTETQTCPNGRQQELAALMTDAGADIVVGSHAHRLQGMGYLGDQFVAYGLSNFIFQAPSEPGRRSGVLTVSATGRRIDGYRWDPAVLQGNLPVPLSGAAQDAGRAAMDELQVCTGLSGTPTGPGFGG